MKDDMEKEIIQEEVDKIIDRRRSDRRVTFHRMVDELYTKIGNANTESEILGSARTTAVEICDRLEDVLHLLPNDKAGDVQW
jgi:hypothetical protein